MKHYTTADFPFRKSIAHHLAAANQLKDRMLDKYLGHLDITAAQFKVLFFIGHNRANTPAELCRELSLDSGSMTRMLDRLEKKELLLRHPCPNDRRSIRLKLSPAGEAINAQAPEIATSAMNDLVECLSAEELQTLVGLLDKVLSAHGASVQPAEEN
ncbi:Transcriptional regulator SlyA [compost metagenome]|uniref:DNA-binding transcriptional regulator, MarR family n=1 Tax=Pseudomonas jinjuensis TaxID=198616 RepID=A0A1H0K576_9PSED|nr:MarR family transcriptional regulator [Pseudomonas jinjuensis]SDO51238.1 DNA-binding transcriptional regulator, MarR family [Pseudomonas jinjuensis]